MTIKSVILVHSSLTKLVEVDIDISTIADAMNTIVSISPSQVPSPAKGKFMMFKRLVALIVVLTFSVSVATTAEESEMKANIIAEAIADVMRDINGTSGSIVGYFLNRIGGNSGRIHTAPIPTGRLLGKPPAYVVTYAVNYQAQQTGNQITVGEVVGGLILIGAGIFCLWQINNEIDAAFDSCLDPLSGGCCSLPEPGGLYY